MDTQIYNLPVPCIDTIQLVRRGEKQYSKTIFQGECGPGGVKKILMNHCFQKKKYCVRKEKKNKNNGMSLIFK